MNRLDPLGMFLQGMTILPGAKGDNVTTFMLALYDWEKEQVTNSNSDFNSPKLYENSTLFNNIRRSYSSLQGENDDKKLLEYAVNDIGLQREFETALMNYNAYLIKTRSDKLVKNAGMIDTITWRSLGLGLNTTLQQEYGFSKRLYGDTVSFSVVGNTISINYYPKLYVCGTVGFGSMYNDGKFAGFGNYLKDKKLWEKYAEWIEHGIEEMFDNRTPIFGITPEINITFNPTVALRRSDADFIVNTKPGRSAVSRWTSHTDSGVLNHFTHYWDGSKYEYSEIQFRRTAAHEFGHVLGLGDAYLDDSRPVDYIDIFPNSLMKYQWDGYIVSGNDLEMLLWSWKNNTWERYSKGVDGSQAFYYRYEEM